MKPKVDAILLCRYHRFRSKHTMLVIACIMIVLIDILGHMVKQTVSTKWTSHLRSPLYSNSIESNTYNDRIELQRSVDIVLSYYSEDVDFVAQYIRFLRNVSTLHRLNPRVIVYNKNRKVNNEALKLLLEADAIQLLPNVGREGGTYLHHIVSQYHIIANHTIFSQAGVEGITGSGLTDWFRNRLEKQFNASVGYMPLVSNAMISNYDCGVHRTGNFPRLVQLWAMLEQTLCPPGGQAVAFRGQFLVSGQRIRSRPLNVYKYLLDLITANSSHWIHRDLHSMIFKSTPDNPIFGHVVERIWTVLFRCSKPDLLERCQRQECACYD